MPRSVGGRRFMGPAGKFDWRRIGVSHLAVLSAAFLVIAAAPGRAADEVSDVDFSGPVSDEDELGSAGSSGNGAGGGLTVEGLVYWRKDLQAVPFTTAGNAVDPFVQFDSSELKGEDYAPGMRVSLKAAIFDQPISLSAFYVLPMGLDATKLDLDQDDTDAIYNVGNGNPFYSTNSDDIFGLSIHHETKLFGAEANLLQPFGIPGLLVGVRALNFGEELSSTAIQDADDVPGGSDNDRDHIDIRADNRLLGLQIGLDQMFDVGDFMRVGGSIKGGLYNNFVDINGTFISENRPDLRNFARSDHDDVFSQVVEFNPRIEFKLAEGTYLTAAGQFLWINNVSTALPHYATAEEDLGGLHNVRANDDVYFYGGSLGLTMALDQSSPISNSLSPFDLDEDAGDPGPASIADIEERVAALEESAARKGNEKVSFEISGWISRMLMAWDDGAKKDVYIVDNVSSRSRINFEGAAKIARGWSAGYFLSIGLDDQASNDLDQLVSSGEDQIDLRHSAWWLRSSLLGRATLGLTSTATDNIILKDVGGIMPGAQNIALIGGSILMRRADYHEQGYDGLVNSGAYTTTLNDMVIGGSVDTLRRNIIRYDAPRFRGLWGNVDLSVAWGEDDFFDAAFEHGINYNDWKFRFGAGYLHDTDENGRPDSSRDRREYKGSASLLHIPTGLFATGAYVRRTFHGTDPSNQAVFGENVVELLDPNRPNRPPADYMYTAWGLRRQYWPIGDTSIYGEYAQVWDSIKGLREADLHGVTESRTMMLGAAISQDIDAAAMDVYAGFRLYTFDVQGVEIRSGNPTAIGPAPLTDLMIGYTGARIKF
jgi:hypothetical protein